MFLHGHIATRLIELSGVTDRIGKNTRFADLNDQYCIRTGGLFEDDPYPGIAILCPNQDIESDLSDVTKLVDSEVIARVIDTDLANAYRLGNAGAWNSQTPKERGQGGLDGWSNSGVGIQSCGLQRVTEETLVPTGSDDQLLWVLEYTYSVHWHPRS